jgi:putative hydrolase of the HAD superfamily
VSEKTPIRVVVFDLDDTLFSEAQYVRCGYQAVAECLTGPKYNKKKVFQMLWKVFERGPRNRVFNNVLEQMGQGVSESQIAALISVYRSHRPNIQLEPEMMGVLAELRKTCKLGLITDGYLPAQRYKVEALRLEQWLDHIIYTEELGRTFWKPAAKAFELMAEHFACGHAECVYVADNIVKDFIAPNRLGWLTVQIQRPDRIHGDVKPPAGGRPKKIITKIEDLKALL